MRRLLLPLALLPALAGAQQRAAARQAALPRTAPDSATAARLVAGLRWRMVGPARGGRVTAVTGVVQEPHTFYMGATGGGVWKTVDAGITWRNVTDGFLDVGSIGAIDVADSDPNVVWVGTGSEGLRSNVSIGKGIWKSTDAGRTWRLMGLRDAGQLGAVVVHPTDPNVVFAAALGNPFAPNRERGVYRTTDGGATWKQVHFVSDSTGVVDLELEPGNPRVVYAAAWRAERKPWTIVSGARGCAGAGQPACEGGLWKSEDGGDTWRRLGGGLPDSLVGKIDLAVSPAHTRRVYALVEAKPGGGLYRSDDAGATWTLVSSMSGHERRRRPDERRRRLRGHRELLQVHRRRPHLAHAPHAARRQPRPLDPPARPEHRDPVERRRRQRHARRHAHVEHAVQPADGRDLPGRRRRPGAVSAVRRAAGQLDAHRPVAAARVEQPR
jgi:photosystem II stability/assembly factor-like uncharacterized protein